MPSTRVLVLMLAVNLATLAGAGGVTGADSEGPRAPIFFTDPTMQTCDDPDPISRRLLLAQQGCCSSHSGVCGCSSAGRTLCCDGTQSPTCTCTPPPTHTLTITAGPTGIPNPVASGGAVQLDVTATDSLGHALTYTWSVLTCLTSPSDGSFNNVSSRTPIWTAPVNTASFRRFCSIQVEVSDGQGLSRLGFVTQGIDPAPPPPAHTLTITAGPNGTPNPVASGASVNLDVMVVDSLGHAISYSWAASCQGLPSSGAFNNVAARTPVWTAPTNGAGTRVHVRFVR